MGTGSVLSGGSGSGGGGRYGGYEWDDMNELQDSPIALDRVRTELADTLCTLTLNHPYVDSQFSSLLMGAVYEGLFDLNLIRFHSSATLSEMGEEMSARSGFNASAQGFLKLWAASLVKENEHLEQDAGVRTAATENLDDFLLSALDEDHRLYVSGSAEEVLGGLRQAVFNSTSANFLKIHIARLVRRQYERQRPEAVEHISSVVEEMANQIVESFRNDFESREYRDMYRTFRECPDWLRDQIRRAARGN